MQTIEDREDMNNYIELLILAYFKQFQEQYSFGDILMIIFLVFGNPSQNFVDAYRSR